MFKSDPNCSTCYVTNNFEQQKEIVFNYLDSLKNNSVLNEMKIYIRKYINTINKTNNVWDYFEANTFNN